MDEDIGIEDLGDIIEKKLCFYEKVSIMFLLYGASEPLYATQKLFIALQHQEDDTNFLSEWAYSKRNSEWRTELVETLSIIQSNKILLSIGVDDESARLTYLSQVPEISTFVHPILKVLYHLCEKMEKNSSVLVQNQIIKNHPEAQHIQLNEEFFEIFLLHLISSSVINIQSNNLNLTAIISALKNLEMYELEDFLKNSVKNCQFNDLPKIKEPQKNYNLVDRYKIEKNSAGYLLIINQKNFKNTEKSDLEKPLNERRGTDVDKDTIMTVFLSLGYHIIVEENLKHNEILKVVERLVQAMSSNDDSLIVCILSHGQEGKIYGVDSVPVNVKEIEKLMASENLIGKPKILIIQACQGTILNKAIKNPSNKLEKDCIEGGESTASVYCDFLVAWSTIPGFASIRHIEKGSWFIQELCQKINKLHKDEHLMNILTMVINDVSGKRGYDNECMVPTITSTLRKKLYLSEN